MGRSAKLHKRIPKKKTSSTSAHQPSHEQIQTATASAKKKATVRSKTAKNASTSTSTSGRKQDTEHVLGGADYVSLMMGSRKKAREEGAKLPRGD